VVATHKQEQISRETAEHLAIARLRALVRAPYYARLMHALSYVNTPGLGTVGIDEHLRLYVDQDAVNKWTSDELSVVLLHEVNHVLRDHASRCQVLHGSPELWNIAADAEINDDLVEGGFVLPDNPVLPSTLHLPDKETAEFYYVNIHKRLKQQETETYGLCCGSGATGQRASWELSGTSGEIPGVSRQRIRVMRENIATEIREGKFRGLVPGNLERWAESFGRSEVPWEQLLYSAVRKGVLQRMGQVDYTWARPNRRHRRDVILPSLRRPSSTIAIIVDTSGSMNQSDLDHAYTEARAVAEQATGSRVTLIACDSEASVISEGRLPSHVQLSGGGGTDMGAAIDVVRHLRRVPDVVIVLTDGETPWPSECPTELLGSFFVVGVIRVEHGFDMSSLPTWCSGVEIVTSLRT